VSNDLRGDRRQVSGCTFPTTRRSDKHNAVVDENRLAELFEQRRVNLSRDCSKAALSGANNSFSN
jgi:hypothetical protein